MTLNRHHMFLFPALIGLAACVQSAQDQPPPGADADPVDEVPFEPQYEGISTVMLDDSLVNFQVAMRGARDQEDVMAYANCAAAQYALIRGAGFARHIRSQVAESSGIWRGDAVYTISTDLPRGVTTIDAEVAVRDCTAQGIPTV